MAERSDTETAQDAPPDEFEYVHRYYNVPARRDMRVIAAGHPGTIVGAAGNYIRVLLDGDKHPSLWHPTWAMKYVDA